ncbi:MAG: transglutaminase-like cysteine peptidase [Pseudochelatococcus sp.]|uniref:transglutaminase-like cysteine peptidase n=1 Tax=Pseudochelatococcus sp. TaxID=2020869 RepID=UPI003D918DC7
MFRIPFHAAAAAFCFALVFSGFAGDAAARTRLPPPAVSHEAWSTETGLTSHPVGWEDFCGRNAAACRIRDDRPGSVTLDARTWSLILKVNMDVNAAVSPLSDEEHWGVAESWDFPDDGFGDCEDYVLQKRRLLHRAGLPLAALMITVVRDLEDAGHAVLTVRTDRGDLILDNKRDRVLNWADTGYKYIKRQANLNPNRWVALGTTPPTMSVAAR